MIEHLEELTGHRNCSPLENVVHSFSSCLAIKKNYGRLVKKTDVVNRRIDLTRYNWWHRVQITLARSGDIFQCVGGLRYSARDSGVTRWASEATRLGKIDQFGPIDQNRKCTILRRCPARLHYSLLAPQPPCTNVESCSSAIVTARLQLEPLLCAFEWLR